MYGIKWHHTPVIGVVICTFPESMLKYQSFLRVSSLQNWKSFEQHVHPGTQKLPTETWYNDNTSNGFMHTFEEANGNLLVSASSGSSAVVLTFLLETLNPFSGHWFVSQRFVNCRLCGFQSWRPPLASCHTLPGLFLSSVRLCEARHAHFSATDYAPASTQTQKTASLGFQENHTVPLKAVFI